MIPKNGPSIDKSNNQGIQLTPIDFAKITGLFSKANKP